MSTYIRNNDLAALRESLAKLEAFLGASIEPGSTTCASFGPHTFVPEFTEEQRRQVRIYLESWVAEPLRAALTSILGDRTWANECYLREVASGHKPQLSTSGGRMVATGHGIDYRKGETIEGKMRLAAEFNQQHRLDEGVTA